MGESGGGSGTSSSKEHPQAAASAAAAEGGAATTTTTTSTGNTVLSHSRDRHHHHNHRRRRPESIPAFDIPPPVATPFQGQWMPRRYQSRTPQRLATLQHPPPLLNATATKTTTATATGTATTTTHNNTEDNNNNNENGNEKTSGDLAGTALCNPLLLDGRWLLSVTNDGRLCLYSIAAFPTQEQKEQRPIVDQEVQQGDDEQQEEEEYDGKMATSNLIVSQPCSVISLESDASIVHMVALSLPSSSTSTSTSIADQPSERMERQETNESSPPPPPLPPPNSPLWIFIVSVEGDVHLVKLLPVVEEDKGEEETTTTTIMAKTKMTSSSSNEDEPPAVSNDTSSPPPSSFLPQELSPPRAQLQLYQSWNTGSCGATCLSVQTLLATDPHSEKASHGSSSPFGSPTTTNASPRSSATSNAATTTTTTTLNLQLMVGYDSGCIEAWSLRVLDNSIHPDPRTTTSTSVASSPTTTSTSATSTLAQLRSMTGTTASALSTTPTTTSTPTTTTTRPSPTSSSTKGSNNFAMKKRNRPLLLWRGILDRRIRSMTLLPVQQRQEQQDEEGPSFQLPGDTKGLAVPLSPLDGQRQRSSLEPETTTTTTSDVRAVNSSTDKYNAAESNRTTQTTQDAKEMSEMVEQATTVIPRELFPNASDPLELTTEEKTKTTESATTTRLGDFLVVTLQPEAAASVAVSGNTQGSHQQQQQQRQVSPSTSMIEVIDLGSVAHAWQGMTRKTTASASTPKRGNKNIRLLPSPTLGISPTRVGNNKYDNDDNDEKEEDNDDPNTSNGFVAVPLHEHWILPDTGMGIVNASTLPSPIVAEGHSDSQAASAAIAGNVLPRRTPVIPSPCSDCACTLLLTNSTTFGPTTSSTNGSGSTAAMPSCGVTLPDGTVALLSAKGGDGHPSGDGDENDYVSRMNDYLSWGILKDDHQLLLSYPAIGCGCVYYQEKIHFACCLRGGTSYLIPIQGSKMEQQDGGEEKKVESKSVPANDDSSALAPKITVISYPLDVDSNVTTTHQYLQGFVAGNIWTRRRRRYPTHNATDEDGILESTPVLVYSWSGGIIDVYTCGLSTSSLAYSPPQPVPDEAQQGTPQGLIELSYSSSSSSSTEKRQGGEKKGEIDVRFTIQELLDNGAVQLLWGVLQTMETGTINENIETDAELLKPSDLNKALVEYQLFLRESPPEDSPTVAALPTCDQILSNSFTTIRSLLLCLARTSSN